MELQEMGNTCEKERTIARPTDRATIETNRLPRVTLKMWPIPHPLCPLRLYPTFPSRNTYFSMMVDGIADPFLCSSPLPLSSTFIGEDTIAFSAEDDATDRFVRRSSFIAIASHMKGDNKEKLLSNS